MWIINPFLLFLWAGAPSHSQFALVYNAFVAGGASCYAAIPDPVTGQMPTTPQPGCFYDPANTNSFTPYPPAQ
jgi:hypothetical protein